MAKFEQPPKQRRSTKANVSNEVVVEQVTDPAAQAKADELKAKLDSVLDEVDGVLETNAEDFVKAYVQKGGE